MLAQLRDALIPRDDPVEGVPAEPRRPRGVRGAAARKAPTATPAMMLCPHAWPMPGSASHSAMIAKCGADASGSDASTSDASTSDVSAAGAPPSAAGNVVRSAVGSPNTPTSTSAPWLVSSAARRAADACSANPISGSS